MKKAIFAIIAIILFVGFIAFVSSCTNVPAGPVSDDITVLDTVPADSIQVDSVSVIETDSVIAL